MDQSESRSRIEELRPPPPERGGRPSGSMLSIFLAGGVGLMALAVLFFLFAPLGGVVLGVVGIVFLLAAFAFLHFVVWGWWLGGVIKAEVVAEEQLEAAQRALPKPKLEPIPTTLEVVAALFILFGMFAALQNLNALHALDWAFFKDVTLLGIFIGPGLMRRSRICWQCALIFLSLELTGTVWASVRIIETLGPFDVWVWGQHLGQITKGEALSFAAVVLLLFCWQIWVLLQPGVRKVFALADS